MKPSHMIRIDLPLTVVEPLFTLLHTLKATNHSRLEMKAVSVLRVALMFELEKAMQTEEEETKSKVDFEKIFAEQRERRAYRNRDHAK